MAGAWSGYSASPSPSGASAGRRPAAATALPSWAILALGSLTLTCLALLAVLVAIAHPADSASPVSSDALAAPVAASAAGEPTATEPTSDEASQRVTAAPVAPEAAAAGAAAGSATYTADPLPVPAELITRLEASSNEPLHGELTQLLAAIQYGFGVGSAQLDPALRSYTARMASRFEWNPDTFRVAVSAPEAGLADARASTLRRLFSDAVTSRRLVIQTVTGPDALTLEPR